MCERQQSWWVVIKQRAKAARHPPYAATGGVGCAQAKARTSVLEVPSEFAAQGTCQAALYAARGHTTWRGRGRCLGREYAPRGGTQNHKIWCCLHPLDHNTLARAVVGHSPKYSRTPLSMLYTSHALVGSSPGLIGPNALARS